MAHDLYHNKDKLDLAKTNPRSHSFGALSSGDMQYKNYLAGMKPRVKTPDKDRNDTTRSASNSNNFRKSAGVNNDEKDEEKLKTSRALYTELSSVPSKKTTSDLSFDKANAAPVPKPKPKMDRVKSNSFDQENETVPSVGKLRSMFDNPNSDKMNSVPLRNNDGNKKRDNLKRHSAMEPLQRPKSEIKKIDVNVVGRVKLDVDAMVRDDKKDKSPERTVPKSTLNIDAMISIDNNDETKNNDAVKIDTIIDTNKSAKDLDNTTPSSKTKGMHGLLQRKGSEFDDFEDRIVVPTGSKAIDINSLLAPAPADDNNNNQENVSENKNEQPMNVDFDLSKKRELDRLIQAQQEVTIHKAFNIKRRSLKDRLSDMSSISQDSFDHEVVPYESASQAIEQPSINIDSHVNQTPSHNDVDKTKISSTIEINDKQSEIIDECIVISDPQVSIGIPEVVEFVDNNDKLTIESSVNIETNVNNSVSDFKLENGVGTGVSGEIPHEINVEITNNPNQTKEEPNDIDNITGTENEMLARDINLNLGNEHATNNAEIARSDLSVIVPNKMNIIKTEPSPTDSGDDSGDLTEDKTYESIVDRFDAFLTSHGIADPDILSPVPISDVEMDVKVLTGILDGKLETSDDVSSSFDDKLSNVGSNDLSLPDDETSKDTSDNFSSVDEKLSTDVSDEMLLLADDKLSDDIPCVPNTDDEVSLSFHPDAHSSQDDLTNNSLLVKSDNEPSESLSLTSTDGDMNLMDEILGHLEKKGDDNVTLNDGSSDICKSTESEAKLILPSIPKIHKQDKIDFESTQSEIGGTSDTSDSYSLTVATNKTNYEDASNDIEIMAGLEVDNNLLIRNVSDKTDSELTVTNTIHTELIAPVVSAEVAVSNREEDTILTSSVEAPSIVDVSKVNDSENIKNDVPITTDAQPISINSVDVASTENAIDKNMDTNLGPASAHQLLKNLAASCSEDKASSDQSSVSMNVSEEKLPIGESSEKDEPSSSASSETDYVTISDKPVVPDHIKEHRIPSSSKPKKSNLSKGKGNASKKVNFKDPSSHDVINTYGPTEYDRANADIDPISSSAEWELEKRVDKMDVFSVDLQKDERGLGLSIIGLGVGTETGVEKLGIFVKTLTENGASQKDGRIQVNDQILEVNGISLVGVTQYFAAQTLKNTEGVVRFLMGREKSRRSQYAPGSSLAGNAEMHKHVEEMNKVLQQLEEFEDRAINAESTLEDVKLELLKAEERAHEAERQLKDTKEQLTAVTESPFVGSSRKLKNEIKKRGGKHDKMDTLQRSLTDVTHRLSTSEENLSGMQVQNENKDKQIGLLTQKVSDQDSQVAQLENDIGCKKDEINNLRLENVQLKEQLNVVNERHEMEKENLARVQIEMAVKAQGDVEEMQNRAKSLENENKCLKDEIVALTRRLEINEQLLREVTESQDENDQMKQLQLRITEYEAELELTKEANGNLYAEIESLKEKNEYLQSLIVKLEREELEPDKIDIEQKFKEKEEEYLKQNDILRAKISDLEEKLRFTPQEISPTLPYRGYVNVNELNQHCEPPEISRDTKPSPAKEPAIKLEIDINKTDYETNLISNDSGIGSVNNINDIEVVVSDDVNSSFSPNPIPKPERGNFISISPGLSPSPADNGNDKQFILDHTKDLDIKDIKNEKSDELSPVEISMQVNEIGLDLNDSSDTGIKVEEVQLDVGSTEEIITDKIVLSSTPVQVVVDYHDTDNDTTIEYKKETSFDLDDLPEGQIDNDSEEDQGQFQLIQEDVEEEQPTPAPTNRTLRIHSDVGDSRKAMDVNGDLDGSLVNDETLDEWLDKDWRRLDSAGREERAEKIAAEVSAHAPTLRKGSSSSSTSSEENKEVFEPPKINGVVKPLSERSHSIKIDASYFEKSVKVDDSFDDDGAIDVIDQPVDDHVVEITPKDVTGDITKSLSFDSAIPPTAVLDNRIALDKKAVMNNQRAKPSRSPRVGAAAGLSVSIQEPESPQSAETSTLPRSGLKKTNKLQAAQSVPNLSMVPDYEKPSKRKHRYVFHLPKAFKRTKLGKKLSQDSFNKRNKDNVLSLSDTDLSSHPDIHPLHEEEHTPYTPSLHAEADVVPIAEKTAALNLEKANDAATEEAVVPFADKEMLMTSTSDSEISLHMHSGEKGSLSQSPQSQNHLNLEDSSPSLSSRSFSETRHEYESSHSSHRHPPNDSSTEIEFSSFTASPVDGSSSPVFYNERGVDVEMTNGHSEVDTSYKNKPVNQWDVKQVGLWMAEINMSNYVNSFKLHNVDGLLLLRADGRELKEYGVHNQEHRAHIKKYIKEFRQRFGKCSSRKDHKSTKDKLQFWKGKYKLN